MSGFLGAHGYDPGPTQRPCSPARFPARLRPLPALALLHALRLACGRSAHSRPADCRDDCSPVAWLMAFAGALYARLFGRAANDAARRLAVRNGVRLRLVGGRRRFHSSDCRRRTIAGWSAGYRGLPLARFVGRRTWGRAAIHPPASASQTRRCKDRSKSRLRGCGTRRPAAAPLACSCSGEHAVRVDVICRMIFHDGQSALFIGRIPGSRPQ